jgi:hypothetical protein
MREAAKGKDALKITHQRRAFHRDGMCYGLKCEGVVLTLDVARRANDQDPGEWRIEARVKRPTSPDVVAAEWGDTRSDALREVGRSWDAKRFDHGLDMFDWEDVSRVLNEVRAL